MTCNSGAKVAVLNAKNLRRSQGPIEACNSDPKVAVLMQKPQMRAGTNRD